MRTIKDASNFIRNHLGDDVADVFDVQIDEALYFSRAMAFDDTESLLNEIEEKFGEVAQSVLMEVANSYLETRHGSDDGKPQVNVDWDCVYDRDMNVIEPIAKLTEKQNVIVSIITKSCMSMFRKGRRLAHRIISKRDAFLRTKSYHVQKDIQWRPTARRDYRKRPPMERVEVEIMRLERKLPNISPKEGKRLSLLYRESRTTLA